MRQQIKRKKFRRSNDCNIIINTVAPVLLHRMYHKNQLAKDKAVHIYQVFCRNNSITNNAGKNVLNKKHSIHKRD